MPRDGMNCEEPMRASVSRLEPLPLTPLSSDPLVSVLVPNYNYGRYIGRAIESVLRQTYQKFEIIICDDGSTDDSLRVIYDFAEKDKRVQYILKENGGQASALNRAYEKSRGEILCILDSDDEFLPTKLETIVDVFKKESLPGMVIHRMEVRNGSDNYISTIPIFTPFERGFLASKLYSRGGRWRYMPASAICLRREVANQLFPIPEDLFRSVADAYLFTLAPILTTVDFSEKVLGIYRLHGHNLTGAGDLSAAAIEKTLQNIERFIRGVNNKLRTLGLPPLCVQKNLTFKQQRVFLMLATSRINAKLLEGIMELTRSLLQDDLYRPIQKLGLMFAVWTSLLMPPKLRTAYLRIFTHPNKIKDSLRKFFQRK